MLNLLVSWLRRVRNAVSPGRMEREIEREVSFHIAERADELRAAGMSEREAWRRAQARFGNPLLHAERAREVHVVRWLDALVRDTRYAVRTLMRRPGFTATVVLTLALGIGANTAIFSALDAVILRPLPFPEPDRLVQVSEVNERNSDTQIPPGRLEDWRRMASAFDALTGYYDEDVSETSADLPERVRRAVVSPGFLEVWRIAPARGRGFTEAEHRFGGPPAVLVSDRFWRTRLGADPHVLNRTVRLATTSHPIVGVMPEGFRFPDRDVDLWFPARVDAPYAQTRESPWYTAVGRLREGVTPARAREDLARVQARLAERYPETDRGIDPRVVPLKQSTVGELGASLWLLFGAVSVLLLVACTNIAALLLSRAAHRREELAVRQSLGASRGAVVAQLLTETFVLAIVGGALGLLAAAAASGALRAAGAELPRFDEVAIDGRVLLYTLASTVAVALACGLLPALRTAAPADALRGAGRTQVSTRNTLQWLLVGAQVTLSVALLAGAGLLVRSFHELSRVEPGFDTRNVLSFRVSGSWAETDDLGALGQRIERTIDALAALPGVESAATSGWDVPGVPAQWETTLELVEEANVGRVITAEGRAVSPGYFATMRIPLLAGEPCRNRAPSAGPDVPGTEAMINRAFVARYLSDRPTPIGLHLRQPGRPASRIAGVVGDARERGLDRDPGPTLYWCSTAATPMPYFLIRTHREPEVLAGDVRRLLKDLDPLRAVYEVAPLEERIGDAFAENRLRMVLLALFAATALALACVGLYGTLSYAISLRRREVGLRLALGAMRRTIVTHFLARALLVVTLACIGGIALAIASARVLAGMLFGVSAADPLTLSGVTGIVMLVAALAVLIPSARAAFVDPMRVLRDP
jgi:putative ABC transport system permease protein